MKDDAELLRLYATERSEEAFTELIGRHVDLVYSAALRLANGDTHRAQDVTQQVFAELARQSTRLSTHPALVGWLYTIARRVALRAIRSDQRRTVREREAHTMNELLLERAAEPAWDQLGTMLEEAMHSLSDKDRLVILLRFFQNKTLGQVGLALGLRENAARMRVDRALEKLRAQLARKGVTTTNASLAVALSANGVSAAPPAFVSGLASASLASVTAGAGTTLNFLELMAITKSQLGLIGAVVVASIVTPLVIQHQAQATLREQDLLLRQQGEQRALLEQENLRFSSLLARAQPSSASFNGELLRLRGEVARLRKDVQDLSQAKGTIAPSRSDVLGAIAERYSERIKELKQFLAEHPSESIPELRFMTDKDWLWLAGEKTPDTPQGYRRAMSFARLTVEGTVTREILRPALELYGQDHNGEFPAALSQLGPYFKTLVDAAILERWHILHASKFPHLRQNLRNEDWVITQKAPVNRALDQRIVFSLKDFHMFADAPPEHWDVVP